MTVDAGGPSPQLTRPYTTPWDSTADTIYECPDCEARYLGTQRCEDCNRWCRRLGPGGPCPHCDGLVVLADVLSPEQLATGATRQAKERS